MKTKLALVSILATMLVVAALLSPARSEPPAIGKTLVTDLPQASAANVLTNSLAVYRDASRLHGSIAFVSTDSTLTVQIVKSGATTRTYALNGGTAYTAGVLYTFSFDAHKDCTYNFQLGTTSTVGYLHVSETTEQGAR